MKKISKRIVLASLIGISLVLQIRVFCKGWELKQPQIKLQKPHVLATEEITYYDYPSRWVFQQELEKIAENDPMMQVDFIEEIEKTEEGESVDSIQAILTFKGNQNDLYRRLKALLQDKKGIAIEHIDMDFEASFMQVYSTFLNEPQTSSFKTHKQ